MTNNSTATIEPPAAPSLHQICEDTRRVDCTVCAALSGDECVRTTAPVSLPVTASIPLQPLRGYHVLRFGTAMRAGRISGPDLIAVLRTAVVFTVDTVVWDQPRHAGLPSLGDEEAVGLMAWLESEALR
jgi:hypothetical protein